MTNRNYKLKDFTLEYHIPASDLKITHIYLVTDRVKQQEINIFHNDMMVPMSNFPSNPHFFLD